MGVGGNKLWIMIFRLKLYLRDKAARIALKTTTTTDTYWQLKFNFCHKLPWVNYLNSLVKEKNKDSKAYRVFLFVQ